MPDYKKILIAVDLVSQDDEVVTAKGRELAEKFGAEMSLIHVIEQHTYAYGTPFISEKFIEWQAELEQSAKAHLAKLGEKLAIPADRQYIPTGQTQTCILELADEAKVDLIVVGSHGRHGLGLVLMGSTAGGVLHHASCDVLAVRVQEGALGV